MPWKKSGSGYTKKSAAPGKGGFIKNPATYEAIKRDNPNMSKASAAAISNAALAKGQKKGVHRKPGERGKPLGKAKGK
jgi:hypothetical protein